MVEMAGWGKSGHLHKEAKVKNKGGLLLWWGAKETYNDGTGSKGRLWDKGGPSRTSASGK